MLRSRRFSAGRACLERESSSRRARREQARKMAARQARMVGAR